MAGIYSQGGSAGHRYAGWLSEVEAKNFQFGGKVFNGSPSAIYVGSNLVWAGRWLTGTTLQAILGAFGQRDGWAVINATNAYLNQLAASDRDKATALAGFINKDPMMVCSLGLEVEGVTMPIRWLVGDGNCWIDSGVKPTQYPLSIKMKGIFYGSIQSGDHGMIGCWDGSRGFFIGYTGNRTYLWTGNSAIYPETAQIDTICPLDVKFNASNNVVYQFGGASGTSSSASPFSSSTIAILGGRGGSSYGPLKGGVSEVTMVADGTTYQFVPFKDGNDAKYMDLGASLETGTKVFLTKRGSGTLTIPDISYTPSTP